MAEFVGLMAIAAMVSAMTNAETATGPVRLDVRPDGASNVIRVIAEAGGACTATYELAVSASGGGNRSVNRGIIKFPAKGEVTVATVKVGRGGNSGMTATLDVTPCDGKPYQQVWTSGEGATRG